MPQALSNSGIRRNRTRGKAGVRGESSIGRLAPGSRTVGRRLRGVAAIRSLAPQAQALNQTAFREYTPIVEDILNGGCRDVQRIEHTLDGLLVFAATRPCLPSI